MNSLNCFIEDPDGAIPPVSIEGPHTGIVIPLAVVSGGAGVLVPPPGVVPNLEVRNTSEVWTGAGHLSSAADRASRN